MHTELCECRAGPTTGGPGGLDSLGTEVIGGQAGIVDLQHQAGVVDGSRQDLGVMGSVSRHPQQPQEGPATPLLQPFGECARMKEKSPWCGLFL